MKAKETKHEESCMVRLHTVHAGAEWILPQSCVGWRMKPSKQEDEAMLSKPKRFLRMNNVAWHICQ